MGWPEKYSSCDDKLSRKWAWSMSCDLLKYWQASVNISKTVKIETYFQWKTNRKSYMANQMAQTLVTLNDPEGHLAIWHFLSHLLANVTRLNFNMCTKIRQHVAGDVEWAWTLFVSFTDFQVQFVYICAAIYRISTGTPASRGPSAIAELLVDIVADICPVARVNRCASVHRVLLDKLQM